MKITRMAQLARSEGEGENRPFRIVLASGTPCTDSVWDKENGCWRHVPVKLDMADGAIDFAWIAHGVPLLHGHPGWNREEALVARAMNPYVTPDGKLCSDEITWGESKRAKQVRADVEAGVLLDVSIECDYNPDDAEIERNEAGGLAGVVVKRWRPLAASFVVNGADPSSGINRSLSAEPAGAGAAQPQTQTQEPALSAKRTKMDKETMKEALELARRYGIPASTVEEWIDKDTPIADIRRAVLDTAASQPAVPKPTVTEADGYSPDELSGYSVLRAIRALADKRPESAELEYSISRKIAQATGKEPQGMFMPLFIKRDFTTAAGSGSGLVGTNLLANEFIDALKARQVIAKLGVKYLYGLKGNVGIPRKNATTNAYWLAENADAPKSAPQVGQVQLTPHTVGTTVDISRSLLMQSTPAADGVAQDDILDALALAIQAAVFSGTGSDGQPTGIANTEGILTPTIASSGSPTWGEICQFNAALDNNGIDEGKWVVNGKTFGALRSVNRATYGEKFIAEIVGGQKLLADEPAFTTSQLTAGHAIYGNWGDVVIGMWGALDIKVDDCSLSRSGGLRIVGLQDVDIALRHPEAFAYTNKFPTE